VTLDHGCRLLLCLGGENFLLRTRRRIPETDCADPWFLSFTGGPAAYWTLSVDIIIQSAHAVSRRRKPSAKLCSRDCGNPQLGPMGGFWPPEKSVLEAVDRAQLDFGASGQSRGAIAVELARYGPEGTSIPSARGKNVPVVRLAFDVGQRARRSAASSAPNLE
jgi:hypothetical protein